MKANVVLVVLCLVVVVGGCCCHRPPTRVADSSSGQAAARPAEPALELVVQSNGGLQWQANGSIVDLPDVNLPDFLELTHHRPVDLQAGNLNDALKARDRLHAVGFQHVSICGLGQ